MALIECGRCGRWFTEDVATSSPEGALCPPCAEAWKTAQAAEVEAEVKAEEQRRAEQELGAVRKASIEARKEQARQAGASELLGPSSLKTTLIQCPHCGARYNVTSDLAGKSFSCAKCHRNYTVPSVPRCPHCGGNQKLYREATSEGTGCIILAIGVLLAPILLGIPLIIVGIIMMVKREPVWRCEKCGAKLSG